MSARASRIEASLKKWSLLVAAVAGLCLLVGAAAPLPFWEDESTQAYAEWRARPTPEKRAAWIETEGAAGRSEAKARNVLLITGATLAVVAGTLLRLALRDPSS